jgi:chromosomal replication initiator protein
MNGEISIAEIQERVAEHFGIWLGEMRSGRRFRRVARPRQVAMYLARELTGRSLPAIGRAFGGRDHTTILHALRRVEALMANNPQIAMAVRELREVLRG